MPKAENHNTTRSAARNVSHATHGRELAGSAIGSALPAWRHPAEQALVKIADEYGAIEIMASADGDLDATIGGLYRIEVRDLGSRIVALTDPSSTAAKDFHRGLLCPDGLGAMIDMLAAIRSATLGRQSTL